MTKQTAVRIPYETYERLQVLAARTGRTSTFYIRQAIETHLEDLEDTYRADLVLERRQRGESKSHSLESAGNALGLDD